MALVLRKAFMPRNLSLLRNIRARHASTALVRRPANLAKRCTIRAFKIETKIRKLHSSRRIIQTQHNITPLQEPLRIKQLKKLHRSCPIISSLLGSPTFGHLNPKRTLHGLRSLSSSLIPLATPIALQYVTKRGYASPSPAPGPCPGPCTPCCGQCLPPPSNAPPKCIQYVTGYYYYPYGFWFCGPYHVTGPSYPCCKGACSPCLPCSPPSCCPSCPSCLCPTCCLALNPNMAQQSPHQQQQQVFEQHYRQQRQHQHQQHQHHQHQHHQQQHQHQEHQEQHEQQQPHGQLQQELKQQELKQQAKAAMRPITNKPKAISTFAKFFPFQSTSAPSNLQPKAKIDIEKSSKLTTELSNLEKDSPVLKPEMADSKLSSKDLAHYPNCKCSFCTKVTTGSHLYTQGKLELADRKQLPSKHERDNPIVEKDAFSFGSAPKFPNPYPTKDNVPNVKKV